MRVRELAEWLGATFEGDGEKELTAVAPFPWKRHALQFTETELWKPGRADQSGRPGSLWSGRAGRQ